MAGTDKTRSILTGGPAIILVVPQLGENIGATARAMLNFGLTDLRLVRPRDGWPNPAAEAPASGADQVLDDARVFSTTTAAIEDLSHVLAVTARARDSVKTVITPREAGPLMRQWVAAGARVGLMFGGERAGLDNDDMALADTVLTIPANPAFSSLNLAQAVLLLGYEWYAAGPDLVFNSDSGSDSGPDSGPDSGDEYQLPATKDQLVRLFEQLEGELDRTGFLQPPERRMAMVRTLRNMLQRFGMTDQDVRTLRGVIKALTDTRYAG